MVDADINVQNFFDFASYFKERHSVVLTKYFESNYAAPKGAEKVYRGHYSPAAYELLSEKLYKFVY